jgi:hypothetical protein
VTIITVFERRRHVCHHDLEQLANFVFVSEPAPAIRLEHA